MEVLGTPKRKQIKKLLVLASVMLAMFRLIQGFGAGAVTLIATTIVGDIYTTEEREKIQGDLSSGLTFSLHNVYYVVLAFAVICMLLILFIPKKKVESP